MKNKEGKHVGLVPLSNFAVLDKTYPIYRSAQPLHGYQYKWLAEVLGIKLIYNLREENIDTRLSLGLGIGIINFPMRDRRPPTLEIANKFIETIKANEGIPSLIHCEHGHGRTSTFSVLARVALGWDVNAAIREEEEKFHYNFRHESQKDFLVENFSHTTSKHLKIEDYA